MTPTEPKKFEPIFIDIRELQLSALLYREKEMKRQKELLAKLNVFPKSPEDVHTFFSQLLQPNEKSIVFMKKSSEDELTSGTTYIICRRTTIERLEVRDTDNKQKMRYELATQKFFKNNSPLDDDTLFNSFFLAVFKMINQVGKTVEMLIEPNKND